jgi:hypothetical protein
MTVAEAKERIAEKVGVEVGQVRLVYQGGMLVDGKTLAESKVSEGSLIHLILQIRGG